MTTCQFCGREWKRPPGVPDSFAYCPRCSGERRRLAREKFGIDPNRPLEFKGDYVAPRRKRPARIADGIFIGEVAICDDPTTSEEIDQALRDAGYDPDEVAKSFRDLVSKIIRYPYDHD